MTGSLGEFLELLRQVLDADSLGEFFVGARQMVDTDIIIRLSWALYLVIACLSSGHILLNKRDSKAATAWIGVVWLSPYIGSLFYIMFGINRIERRGASIREEKDRQAGVPLPKGPRSGFGPKDVGRSFPGSDLAFYMDNLTGLPLVYAESIQLLVSGEAAYPAMIAAIEGARQRVYLATYIFERGQWGGRFVDALGRAVARGVEVRVLVDDIGSRYSFPSVFGELRRHGITYRKFLPNLYPWNMAFLNLRNHRKVLVVDSELAYTGGMNIRDKHVAREAGAAYTNDLQFEFRGAVVEHLARVFIADWNFAAKEVLKPAAPSPGAGRSRPPPAVQCRVISDGPDVDFEKIKWSLLGAIANARKNIHIVTPYFLPEATIVNALCVAALNGVSVRLIIPERGNIVLLNWAMMPQFEQLIELNCEVYLQAPPFDHSKIMTVDGIWSFVGSSNWDTRSLRLNFEMNVEVYSIDLASQLDEVVNEKMALSKRLTLGTLMSIGTIRKVRNSAARLLMPYL